MLCFLFRHRKTPPSLGFLPGCPGLSSGFCGFWFFKQSPSVHPWTTSHLLLPQPTLPPPPEFPLGWGWGGGGWRKPEQQKESLEVLLGPFALLLCGAEASQRGRSCWRGRWHWDPSMPPLWAVKPQDLSREKAPAPTQPWPWSLAPQSPAFTCSSPRSSGAQARSCPGVTPKGRAALGSPELPGSAEGPPVIHSRGICRPGHA